MRKRRNVEEVETGELLEELSLERLFGYPQHLGASAGAGGGWPPAAQAEFPASK